MRRMDSAKIIGERLRRLRAHLDMGQMEICAIINANQASWSLWESGKRQIPIEPASRICRRFGVTLDWIYFGDIAGMPRRYDKLVSAELGSNYPHGSH